MERSALFDQTGLYRYSLIRRWGKGGEGIVLVLLNPSTADGRRDDPTIRRCIGFAKSWGCNALEVVNLFAYRAPRPETLREVNDPVGPENDAHLARVAREADRIVVAWGINGALAGRNLEVLKMFSGLGAALWCLGTTKLGHPRHVLYLPTGTELNPYSTEAWL